MLVDDPLFLTILLNSGVDPNLVSRNSGGRLLHGIARTNHVEIAEFLIQSGAEVTSPSARSFTQTHYVRQLSSADLIW